MEDSKKLDHHDDISDKKINRETSGIKNKEPELISIINRELNENKNSDINLKENSFYKKTNKIADGENLEDSKKTELNPKLNANIGISNNNPKESNNEIKKEQTPKDIKLNAQDSSSDNATEKLAENVDKRDKKIADEENLEDSKKVILNSKSNVIADKNNPKETSTTNPVKAKTKPVKEPPIEKKPFLEFVNDYLIPEIKNEFKAKGKEVNKINLQKTNRPIAEDLCWVIYCEINDTCNFWLSFEKDDITSLKSFSLCKNYEKPSIIESFLIDEKKITLKLIISRILQRLNGQKLIGAN